MPLFTQLIHKKSFWLILLLLSSLSFILVYAVGVYKESKDRDVSHKIIQARVLEAEEQLKRRVEDINHLLPDDPSRLRAVDDFKDIPVFVYNRTKLWYWSDFHIPETSRFMLEHGLRVINEGNNFYLAYTNPKAYFITSAVLPLKRSYQISSTYLRPQLNEKLFHIEVSISLLDEEEWIPVHDSKGDFLFSYQLNQNEINALWYTAGMLISAVTAMISLLLLVLITGKTLVQNNRFYLSFVLFVSFMLLLRGVMIYFKIPFRFLKEGVFDPQYFASSEINPSLGDMVLNTISLLLIVVFGYYVAHKKKVERLYAALHADAAVIILSILILLSYFSLFFVYQQFHSLNFHSQLNLDITDDITIDKFKILYLLLVVLFSIIFLFINVFILKLAFRATAGLNNFTVITFFVISFFYFIIHVIYLEGNLVVPCIHFLFLAASFYFKLYNDLASLKYISYLFFVFVAFVISLSLAIAISENAEKKSLKEKQRFADQLLAHNDLQGEFLMGEVARYIQQDYFIRDIMKRPMLSKELIKKKIKRIYLDNYFEKYEVNFGIFSPGGIGYMNELEESGYQEVKDKFQKHQYETETDNLYFISTYDQQLKSQYVLFVPVKSNNIVIGHVVLQFRLKRLVRKSIVPRLLQNRNLSIASNDKNYDYAVFSGDELIYHSGETDYMKPAFTRLLAFEQGLQTNFVKDGYYHFVKGYQDKMAIVSSSDDKVEVIITNFSYIFLVLLLTIFLSMIVFSLYMQYQHTRLNFDTKIQIYLNIAYFLPLIIVSVAVLSIMNSNYEADLKASFRSKAEHISANITSHFVDYKNGKIGIEEFSNAILRVNKYAESDINIYNKEGKLLISSQPLLYDADLLSTLLNPEAVRYLIDKSSKQLLLEENIADFKFNNVYLTLQHPRENEVLGVLSIPYFNSKYQLNKNKVSIFSTIVNICALIFLALLALAFFAFQSLTRPLKIISQKLKRISLSGTNEQLQWGANDEIGMLVKEYNQMLVKLEESKKALASSEKEHAWREMAKQVAHEIKNPLTPMKLKLQHVLRTIEKDESSERQRIKQALEAMVAQIDTLSEIATSFSTFAKMPVPESGEFELTDIIRQNIRIFENDHTLTLHNSIPEKEIRVYGDANLVNRTFTNLITNGIQAVGKENKPVITVNVKESDHMVLVEINDNGMGIPEEIQDKVFLPNFSTKYHGSGIGLAIAKRGIEHAGGRIWFETKEGRGTTFFIQLPIVEI